MEQQVYFGNWSRLEDIVGDFEQLDTWNGVQPVTEFMEKNDTYKNMNVLFACYTYEDYSGDALVIFERNGQLYEVHGGHCSCYGLEGQWDPEETTKEYLLGEIARMEADANGYHYGKLWEYRDTIKSILEKLA
jgi:hypothetical protein